MALFILTAQSGIGGDASTYAQFPPGTLATYPDTDCLFIYGKHDPDSAVAAAKGSAVGKVTETSLTSGGDFFNPTVVAGKVYTADISRSASAYGGLMAVQNFSGSTSSLRYGWFMYKGELARLNQELNKLSPPVTINARATNVSANAVVTFGADGKFRSIATTTIRAALNGCGRARVAASGSAVSNIVLFGRIT